MKKDARRRAVRKAPRRHSVRAEKLAPRDEVPGKALDAIRELAGRFVAVQNQARALGLFVHDRELLECRKCGLMEDVALCGQLITYRAGSPAADTGLRFTPIRGNRFRCPACRAVVTEPPGTILLP